MSSENTARKLRVKAYIRKYAGDGSLLDSVEAPVPARVPRKRRAPV